MKTKHYISLFILLLASVLSATAQENRLVVPDVTTTAGRTIQMPVNMEVSAEIVAVQFSITVPQGFSLSTNPKLSERADGHSVTMQHMGNHKYKVLVFSPENKSFKGRTGQLLTVGLTANSVDEETPYAFQLSDVVLSGRNGSNLCTGFYAGKIIIAQRSDLDVSSVQVSASEVAPGDRIQVSWQVKNIGGLATEAGWNEKIFLNAPDGTSTLLGTAYYDDALEVGAMVSRSAEVELPKILGIHGNATVSVKLTASSKTGEPSWLQANNKAFTADSLTVTPVLTLSPKEAKIEEVNGKYVRFNLTRSGSTASEESFALTATADSRVELPEAVTIGKGQSGTYFYAQIAANKQLDDNATVNIAISGNDYPETGAVIDMEDDTLPSLSITSGSQDVEEGKTITFTVTAERAPKEDLEIKLTSDFAARFNVPSITMYAGQTSVDITVEAKQDDVPDVEQVVTFTASAAGYNPASMNIVLVDDDVPTLQLTLTPDAVPEAAGPLSVVAKLRRTDNIDKRVTVKFSDDSDGGIYYGRQTVEMAAGVEEVTVNLGPIDNAIVDGERTYNISAAVWIASCSCNAANGISGGVVTVPLTVYDNDGPALALKASASVVKEGGETTITVSRNTETSAALTVLVSSNHDSALEYSKTVTIPAGKASVNFTVKSIKNDVNGDSFTAVMTIESEGFAKSNVWFMVTDQTLPDAQISDIKVSEMEIEAGAEITVTATLANTGSYELPELTKVGFYISSNSSPLATAYLQSPLAAGESVEMSKTISMPNAVGTYNIYAVANDGHTVKELLYTNNMSATVAVKTLSPYAFTLTTDKDVYQQGDVVEITGSIQGKAVANKAIEVYIINEGHRHVINVNTDESGAFSTIYQPYAGQMGHFAVGACYPKENKKDEMASFDIFGIKRTSNSYITCKALFGEVHNGSFGIKNPGVLPLSGVKVAVASHPKDCVVEVSCPETLVAGATADVSFKITPNAVSEGNAWEHIVLNIETNEGATLETTLYYYCYNTTGKLKASIASIKTTMVKDATRDYPFIITNIGKGETGKVSLALPNWMTAVTPIEMASMANGDSTTVILRFTPTSDMQLNVPVTGQIGINCANGEGLALPFSIEPVSEATGVLTVDVCDEYTYYTSEAPHVQGAQVKVTHPTTGQLLASGTTDESGKFSVCLNEGYYAVYVNADHHDSYRNNILVDPGKEKNVVVNLSIEAITVNWEVEETEIEDEYNIKTTVKYETNVPVPVVEIILPDSIPEGDLIPVEFCNIGLVLAEDIRVYWQDGSNALLDDGEPFDIAPNNCVHKQIPVKNFECIKPIVYEYKWKCGPDGKYHKVCVGFHKRDCKVNSNGVGTIMEGLGDIKGSKSSPISSPLGGTGYGGLQEFWFGNKIETIETKANDCRPQNPSNPDSPNNLDSPNNPNDCMPKALAGCAVPIGSGFLGCGISIGLSCIGAKTVWGYINCGLAGGSCIPGHIGAGFGAAGCLSGLGQCVYEMSHPQNTRKNIPGKNKIEAEDLFIMSDVLILIKDKYLEIMGDSVWLNVTNDDLTRIIDYVNSHIVDDEFVIDNDWKEIKPEMISSSAMMSLLERFANSIAKDKGKFVDSDNCVDLDKMISFDESIQKYNEEILERGYIDSYDFADNVIEYIEDLKKSVEKEQSNSVCSSITLQFEQSMVMTRQAFRGTLTVFNGSETTAMTDIKLNLIITDEDGKIATSHEFQINPEPLTGFVGNQNFYDGWTLDAQETGVVKILFIPTKFAAPTVERLYSFGGTLSYIDPFTGLEVTRTLTPITLTVKPSPNLDLTYFMQRDIIGDDPLTEAVEPCEEAEFALLINNDGYGDATNVRLTTNQPKIVENEKGLFVDFQLLSSQLNGGEKTLALGSSVGTDFGTIPAKSTAYAQWWLKSSLLGHFTEYDTKATHVTSYGNPDLSLLNEVTIHELIRSLDVLDGNKKIVGFMVNDIVDAEDTPDMLYLSNGEIEPVAVATSSNISYVSDTKYSLTVTPSAKGWNYGSLIDPTYGVVKLNKVVRQNDGKEISLRNIWQTDRTLRDGKDPLYENRIHFADDFTGTTPETYILTFEPMPKLLLEVASIEGVPAEGTIACEHVEKVSVMFNKHIDPATFTSDDITLNVQGKKQDTGVIGISTEDNKTFTLDFTELNKMTGNGYYVLTIQTAEITDDEGFNGKVGKSVSWNMYKDGLILINASVYPDGAGTIIGNRNAFYGETISLTANANEGYDFSHWTLNDDNVSVEPELVWLAISDMDIVANFSKNLASIEMLEAKDGLFKVYSIQGVLISNMDSKEGLKRLLPGLYIVNGRKYLVK